MVQHLATPPPTPLSRNAQGSVRIDPGSRHLRRTTVPTSLSPKVANHVGVVFQYPLTPGGISTMLRPTAGEIGHGAGAEGATAPETLRHQGPQSGQALWKVGRFTGHPEGATGAQPGNLSGRGQRGHVRF